MEGKVGILFPGLFLKDQVEPGTLPCLDRKPGVLILLLSGGSATSCHVAMEAPAGVSGLVEKRGWVFLGAAPACPQCASATCISNCGLASE